MRQRRILATVVMICALSSSLLARQGTVITKDNNPFEGDITEDQAAGNVTVVTHGIHYTFKLANVESIIYLDEVDRDVRTKMSALAANDVKGRLALAQYAIAHHALQTAHDVLTDAQKIDPNDPDVRDTLERVKRNYGRGSPRRRRLRRSPRPGRQRRQAPSRRWPSHR